MFRVSPVVYDPSCNFHLFITFEASILDAASTARACSRVALKCNAARLSANTFKLTPYMSPCLCVVVQDDFEDSMDCKLRRNSDTGAHGCESRIAL